MLGKLFGGDRRIAGVIEALDFSAIAAKLIGERGWAAERAAEAVDDYRRFCFLLAKYPGEVIVPWTDDLDQVWHQHILDTRRYRQDCEQIFGRFVHHDPHIRHAPEAEARARTRTRAMFKVEFLRRPRFGSRWLRAGPAGIAALGLTSPATGKRNDGGCGTSGGACGSDGGGGCGGGCGGGS